MTDWIMICITAVYVIATIVICVFNAKSANAAKAQTEEMKKQFESTYRPKIDIRLEMIRSGLMCFMIENVGTEPATDVKIHLCEEFIENVNNTEDKKRLLELNEAVLYIASKQKITVLIASQLEFDKISSTQAEFNIQYNETYNEQIIIDIKQYGFMIIYDSPIEDIRQLLKKIGESQKKFQSDLLKQNKELSRVPVNVLSRTATSKDECKFNVYKAVCKLKHGTLKSISEAVEMPIEETHQYLYELYTVDGLVGGYISDDPSILDENMVWFRKI